MQRSHLLFMTATIGIFFLLAVQYFGPHLSLHAMKEHALQGDVGKSLEFLDSETIEGNAESRIVFSSLALTHREEANFYLENSNMSDGTFSFEHHYDFIEQRQQHLYHLSGTHHQLPSINQDLAVALFQHIDQQHFLSHLDSAEWRRDHLALAQARVQHHGLYFNLTLKQVGWWRWEIIQITKEK